MAIGWELINLFSRLPLKKIETIIFWAFGMFFVKNEHFF